MTWYIYKIVVYYFIHKEQAANEEGILQRNLLEQNEMHESYRFENYIFSADLGDLYDGEATVRLEPQVAKLLQYLLTHQNIVISRDDLIRDVWDHRIVTDDAIGRCVSILRQLLTPNDKNIYIETVRSRGYISHFPSLKLSNEDPTTNVSPDTNKGIPNKLTHLIIAGSTIMILSIIVGFYVLNFAADADANKRPVVAVLPFVTMSEYSDDTAKEAQFFAEGMHGDLLSQLGKLRGLRVIARASVNEYVEGSRNFQSLKTELKADFIIDGSMQIIENNVRINIKLIETKSAEQLWADTFIRELSPSNLFAIQKDVSFTISEAIHVNLSSAERVKLALIPTQNMAAYRAFHRAMQIKNDYSTNYQNDPDYIGSLEEAVALDPSFVAPLSELVTFLALKNFSGQNPESMERAEKILEQLANIAPDSAEYLFAYASYVYYILKDFTHAHDLLSRSIQMRPSHLEAIALKSYIERRQGNWLMSLETLKAMRKLDPKEPHQKTQLVSRLIFMHRYNEAQKEIDKPPFDYRDIEYVQHHLDLRKHKDIKQFQSSVLQFCEFDKREGCAWQALILNRDYQAALKTLSGTREEAPKSSITTSERREAMTLWLMGDTHSIQQYLPEWQSRINLGIKNNTQFLNNSIYFDAALIAGIQGKRTEALQLFKRFFNQVPFDLAEQAYYRNRACRVMSMIDANKEAIKCLKQAFDQPSFASHFLEPFLPFYDPIRETKAFSDLLSKVNLEDKANKP